MMASRTYSTVQGGMPEERGGRDDYGGTRPTVVSSTAAATGRDAMAVSESAGGGETRSETELRRKSGGRRDVEAAEREEDALDVNPPGLHAFTLTYAFLLALCSLGITIAGGASNYWVSARYINNSPAGPVASFSHGGLWHTCGSNGCHYDSPKKARPYQRASQAFFLCFIFALLLGAIVHLMALAQARRKAHSDLAKASGLIYVLASVCGIISMSSFVGKTMNNLHAADNVFFSWSFGLATAGWASLLGLVVPLCYIATEY